MNGYFSEEALQRFAELAALTQSADFAEDETYDFTRCVRPDGTAYGTRGQCKKGSEQAKQAMAPKPRKPRAVAPKTSAPSARKPKANQILGPAGYEAASDKERGAELDKFIKKGAAGKPQAPSRRQAEINARLKEIEAEQRKQKQQKSQLGPEGYKNASDKERGAALDKFIDKGPSSKPQKATGKQAEVNARLKEWENEQRKKKQQPQKSYEDSSDKERGAALDKAMGDSLKWGAEREKPSAKQAAVNARAKKEGF